MSRAGGFTLSAVIGVTGLGEGVYTVPTDRGFNVTRMTAAGTLAGRLPDVLPGQLSVFRNGALVDSTTTPGNDSGDFSQQLQLVAGDQVTARWAGCAPGAVHTLLVEGREE